MAAGALGRRVPPDFEHVSKYPLTVLPSEEQPSGAPVALGINWYSNFDHPVLEKLGRYWVGRGSLGSIRGGHCICVRGHAKDADTWWSFYNQYAEGACVGFGCSRMMSLMNRKRYEARWLWDLAKANDEWPETSPGDDEGTSVRSAFNILKQIGHVPWRDSYKDLTFQQRDQHHAAVGEGISAFRWATSVDQVLATIDLPLAHSLGAVPFYNSWGRDYPHTVWMPGEVVQRLIDEDGEVGIVTDR